MPPVIVCFKWAPKPGYRSKFTAEHPNTLARMVARHYPEPHRFLCITDDPVGVECETAPLWKDFADMSNPTWAHGPNCYPRIKLWDPAAQAALGIAPGQRIIVLDLDCVIVRDVRPLFNKPGKVLLWRTGGKAIPYCGSMVALAGGAHAEVYRCFNPKRSPGETTAEGYRGSDQAWLTFMLGLMMPGWTQSDGVYEYAKLIPHRPDWVHRPDKVRMRGHSKRSPLIMPTNAETQRARSTAPIHVRRAYGDDNCGPLPEGARIVFFCGKPDPWDDDAKRMSPWIEDHYK